MAPGTVEISAMTETIELPDAAQNFPQYFPAIYSVAFCRGLIFATSKS